MVLLELDEEELELDFELLDELEDQVLVELLEIVETVELVDDEELLEEVDVDDWELLEDDELVSGTPPDPATICRMFVVVELKLVGAREI